MNENGVTPTVNSNSLSVQGPGLIIPVNDVTSTPMPTYNGTNKNGAVVVNEPKRRVSIASDPVSESRHSYDNAAFEPHPRRKISQTSVHSHCEIGPVRRKSILMNNAHDNESEYGSIHSYDNRAYVGRINALDNLNAKINHHQNTSNVGSHLEESWIYTFCLRCRGDENRPSWEPPYWQKVCPYPLCPSFRQFSRILSLILIGILIWCTAYVIIGDSAAPGGQLFNLVVLTVAANFGGWLISLTTLPRLIGMLLVGLLFQNVGWVDFSGEFSEVTAILRKFALTIILIRAGLEMEPEAFKKVWKTILKLGVIPWTLEASVVAVMSHYLLNMPWIWSFLLGSIIAAVSPAVVVPCLFRLRTKGYGVAKGIPTLIIAVAGIDDAISVAVFGIISSIMFSDKGMAYQISQAPICIFGGLGFGVAWGYMSRFFPEKGDPFVVPLRTILLFSGGLFSIFGSEVIGYEGAGPLAVVFSAFVSNLFWCQQGWEIEDNPVSTAFEIFWMIFEPILFGITGSTVKISALDPDIVSVGLACLGAGIILRILCTSGIAFGDKLNLKEKIFVALSWMSKATVQAALGPVAMKHLTSESSKEERHYAEIVQTICVLSILLTAPLGAIIISISGTRLLTKTKQPKITEGWRRSHRPSLRDISIIDEEEEREDPELPDDKITSDNTQTNVGLSNVVHTLNNNNK